MDVSRIKITNRDGTSVDADIEDSAARKRIEALRMTIAATDARLDEIASGGDTPPSDAYTTVDEAIAALDEAWGTDAVWDAMRKAGDVVRENPSDFDKYIGEELSYEHAAYGDLNVRVSDVAHYEKSDGSGKAAFVIEDTSLPVKHPINSTNTKEGGYPASGMAEFLQSEYGNYLDGIPDTIRDCIVDVEVPCVLPGESEATIVTQKLFLMSAREIFGSKSGNISTSEEGTRLAWYSNNDSTASRTKKHGTSNENWWTRSLIGSNASGNFGHVSYEGSFSGNNDARANYYVSPIFNIG